MLIFYICGKISPTRLKPLVWISRNLFWVGAFWKQRVVMCMYILNVVEK